jgi:hypothetical protein
VPFAGIAFLWFIGVLRDRLGEFEDRFFATVCAILTGFYWSSRCGWLLISVYILNDNLRRLSCQYLAEPRLHLAGRWSPASH